MRQLVIEKIMELAFTFTKEELEKMPDSELLYLYRTMVRIDFIHKEAAKLSVAV